MFTKAINKKKFALSLEMQFNLLNENNRTIVTCSCVAQLKSKHYNRIELYIINKINITNLSMRP